MDYSLLLENKLNVIGLTGGIGTGKTTVSDYLASQHKLAILDADLYAREALSPGSKGLKVILKRYGPSILRSDHTLDRAHLAQIIFQDAAEKRWLEHLVHPYVRDRLMCAAGSFSDQSIIVMVVPLLFEAHMTDLVSKIWVVSCCPEQQLRRLMERNHLTQQEAQRRIESQMPLVQKCDQADVILDNFGTPDALYAQVDRALEAFCR
jgi:dephospho-CoA kinase